MFPDLEFSCFTPIMNKQINLNTIKFTMWMPINKRNFKHKGCA